MQKVLLYIGSFLAVVAIALLVFYHHTERTYVTGNPPSTATQNNDPLERTITFGIVGDIMLSRNVAGKIKQANDPLLPFRNMDSFLSSNEFNFANLESPFSGKDDFNPSGSLIFNVPRANIEGLKKYFPIVTLANNHAFDQSKAGLDYTEKYLSDNNIIHVGTGETKAEAWQGKIIERGGIKFGFIGVSYASVNDGGKATNENVARIEDVDLLKSSIASLKTRADLVFVAVHAGTEYERTPNESQTEFAHAAIDAGADMVIGAHPHWIQTTEQYKGKYIFYSLGNFIFDQEFSQETKEGLALRVTASSFDQPDQQKDVRILEIEMMPVVIENYCCPRPTTNTERLNILQKINLNDPIINPERSPSIVPATGN
jgi:poly-gamma-glutamate synthesis protein (capsule biosynthesis protein)